MFRKAVGVTGLVMTKLDGTARGGILVAHRREISACRCTSSASAKASTIWRRSRRGISPAPSPGIDCIIEATAMIMLTDAGRSHDRDYRPKPQLNPLLKLALDLGPLVLFFFANSRYGIFVATGDFHGRGARGAGGFLRADAHLPIMPVVTAIIVLVFGGLTLILHNELFIKIKPTILYALFGAVLLGGLFFGKSLLGVVFDSLFHLTEEGWRKLTLRWAIFFFVLAVLNEIVWRNTSTDVWVEFQGVRLSAAHLPVRRIAISAVAKICRGAGGVGSEGSAPTSRRQR